MQDRQKTCIKGNSACCHSQVHANEHLVTANGPPLARLGRHRRIRRECDRRQRRRLETTTRATLVTSTAAANRRARARCRGRRDKRATDKQEAVQELPQVGRSFLEDKDKPSERQALGREVHLMMR